MSQGMDKLTVTFANSPRARRYGACRSALLVSKDARKSYSWFDVSGTPS